MSGLRSNRNPYCHNPRKFLHPFGYELRRPLTLKGKLKKEKKYMEIGSETYDIVTVQWMKSVCQMGKNLETDKKTQNQKMTKNG